jgi:hypothetical protein
LVLRLAYCSGYFVLFRLRIAVSRIVFLFPIVEVFEVTLWFLSFSFFELIFFFFFELVTGLLVYYIGIPLFFVGRVAYLFVWLFLGVFKASEAVIKADC